MRITNAAAVAAALLLSATGWTSAAAQVEDCQPKLTAQKCPTGPVVDQAQDGLDQPHALGGGDPNPDTLGDSYAVYIESDSGETIAFQVLEPTPDRPSPQSIYPLILHGHGYGGSRTTEGFEAFRNAGYGVISIDQRGFGESSGTVRSMDPDFEGQDLVKILDWAEANLPWLAYHDPDQKRMRLFPKDNPEGKNLVVGSMGSSYGGGYQLLLNEIDPKHRLDALVPDITWNDLRHSLNPGDVIKSGWDLPLTAVGEEGSNGQQDPFIKETLARGTATNIFPSDSLRWFNYHSPDYFCGPPAQRHYSYESEPDFPGSTVARKPPPPVDVLLTQGVRDTLFDLNEAFYNYQCLKRVAEKADADVDVRLYTHETGHILPFASVGTSNPLAGGSNPLGVLNTEDRSCGDVPLGVEAELAWFDEKLKGIKGAADAVLGDHKICLSLGPDDAIFVDEMPVGGTKVELTPPIDQGAILAPTGAAGSTPTVVPLGTIGEGGDVIAGIPRAQLSVTLPGGAVPEADSPDPDTARVFDSIIFVGLGRKPAGGGAYELIDDHILPIRGLGDYDLDLVGIAERLQPGDELALMIWGSHGQYPGSVSRDPSVALVQVSGSVALPLQQDNLSTAAE